MIHLHVHSERGSILDSNIKVTELVKRAKELNMPSIALTDHGYTSALVDFYKECKKQNIKPILGCELYEADDLTTKDSSAKYNHILVLAKNNIGYKNLKILSSLGFNKENFYYKPRVNFEMLKTHKEGLIITSACLGGKIPRMIKAGYERTDIIKTINKYKDTFQDFYLEIQAADNEEQKRVNMELIELSHITKAPLVLTTDVHFLKKEDFDIHKIFIKISKDSENELCKDCYLKTEEEVVDVLSDYVYIDDILEAIENTHKISDMCNAEIQLGKSYMPDYPIPNNIKLEGKLSPEDEYLWTLIKEEWSKRGINKFDKQQQQIYFDRIKEEFDVVTKKNFSGYFLWVRRIIQIAKENNIAIGDGRGSAGGSLICYLIGITNVDSVKYNLNFSRFLTLERMSPPDIDTDVQSSKKQELITLLKKELGDNKVAQICAYGTMQAKAVIESVGKVMGISHSVVTEVKKLIPDLTPLKEAIENSNELKEYENTYHNWFETSKQLEGLTKNTTTHAGGVVLCRSDMDMEDFTATMLSKDKEEITQLEMNNIEETGMVKMDLLGVAVLDIIQDCLKLIGKDDSLFDLNNLTDKKTFELIQRGETDGVFQLESDGMKETCIKLHPENMEDISAINALYRPDSMRELSHYIERKHGREKTIYLHPDLEPILKESYGSLIYQEQTMKITKVFAGFSDGEADALRKGIGKKKKEIVQEQANKFYKRALEQGYTEKVCKELTNLLIEMGGYSFNKSHSVGYGITAYKTAYLKANYPVEYMCSLISNQRKETGQTDYEAVGKYILKTKEMGINVKNPDINHSSVKFVPLNNEILYGLSLIKNIGTEVMEQIINNRPYTSFRDFMKKTGTNLNKTVIVNLIKSGCFDNIEKTTRAQLLIEYGTLRYIEGKEDIKPINKLNKNHIAQLIEEKVITKQEAINPEICLEAMNKWRKERHKKQWEEEVLSGNEYTWELDTLSFFLKGSPFSQTDKKWGDYKEEEIMIFEAAVLSVAKTKIKNGKQKGKEMAFITLYTAEGNREGVCFPDVYNRLHNRLEKGKTVKIKAQKQEEKCLIIGAMEVEI